MDNIENIQKRAVRDFDNVFAVIGIIPMLAFFYVIIVKYFSYQILADDIGGILLSIIILIICGLFAGRHALRSILNELLEAHNALVRAQQKLIEKGRVTAITQAAITLSHEINNPLAIISGKLQIAQVNKKLLSAEEIAKLKAQCDRIQGVTEKMSRIMDPITKTYVGSDELIDLQRSK